MIKQAMSGESIQTGGASKKAGNGWFRLLLALITGTATGWVTIPVLAPLLGGASSELGQEAYAHISRASAFSAYVLIWISMLAGLSITSKSARKWRGMSWSFGLHRYTSLLGLGFAVTHALVMLSDKYMNYSLSQVLAPFTAPGAKAHWTGVGQVAIYMFAAIALSFYARNRLGVRTWRLVHALSFALFLATLMHGAQSGGQGRLWEEALYWVSATSVALGAIYRVVAAKAGRSREKAVATGLVAVGGRAQTQPGARVLHAGSLRSGSAMQVSPARVLARE